MNHSSRPFPTPRTGARRRRRQRSAITGAGLGLLLLVLAGCVAAPAPPSVPTDAPSPRWTDPPNRPGEITRSMFGRNSTTFTAQVDGPLRAGDLAVEAGCTGKAGSSMTYTLEGSGGTVFGPDGRVECDDRPTTEPFSSEGVPEGELVQVLIEPGTGMTKGYAILLHPQQ